MSEKSTKLELAPFHRELLELLSRNFEIEVADSEIDPAVDPQAKALLKNLSPNSFEPLMLDEIIENYQHLFGEKGPIHIEKILMESFPPKDYVELGLTRTYPRVYRGLPRLYLRDRASQSHIKRNFTHLPSLKKQALSRALFSLYGKVPAKGKVTIFTWVMNDGLGDFVAASEVMRLLKVRLPEVDFCFIALVDEEAMEKMLFPENSIIIPYKDKAPMVTLEAFFALAESNLILQLPTYYPHTKELMKALPHSKWEIIGEYGFIESGWFHPKSGNYSLGLHFLEKGVLTRKACLASWHDIQNEKLKKWRIPENRFYLAYLATPLGGAIYLHSLLKSLENEDVDVDICIPDLGWFIAYAQRQEKAGKPILEWLMGVGSIEIFFEDKICSIDTAPMGKKVRLLCPGVISQSDFRALLSLSGEWVAIRGDQSFSEVVSQGKAFFFDGKEHARYFIKDFAAIAENRISSFPGTIECVRGMVQGFLYNRSVQDEDWVDESYFQELEDWTAIALKMGLALQDPETIAGFKKLDRIITDEFSANSFLVHMVQRALFHLQHPYVEQLESDNVERFVKNKLSFKEVIKAQKTLIECCQKNSALG